eukprot:m.412380 g.412380  ORF g.412380 m.412380 type:complete len:557 (+) comp20170_c0_seq25:433-2103(+)
MGNEVSSESWYHGHIDEDEARRRLETFQEYNGSDAVFLVRQRPEQTMNTQACCLSVLKATDPFRADRDVSHFFIEPVLRGNCTRYKLCTGDGGQEQYRQRAEVLFDSVRALVHHYKDEAAGHPAPIGSPTPKDMFLHGDSATPAKAATSAATPASEDDKADGAAASSSLAALFAGFSSSRPASSSSGAPPSNTPKGVFHSVRQGNLAGVVEYINQGGDVNIKDFYGNSLLYYASLNAQLPMVQLLVRSGAKDEDRKCWWNSKSPDVRAILEPASAGSASEPLTAEENAALPSLGELMAHDRDPLARLRVRLRQRAEAWRDHGNADSSDDDGSASSSTRTGARAAAAAAATSRLQQQQQQPAGGDGSNVTLIHVASAGGAGSNDSHSSSRRNSRSKPARPPPPSSRAAAAGTAAPAAGAGAAATPAAADTDMLVAQAVAMGFDAERAMACMEATDGVASITDLLDKLLVDEASETVSKAKPDARGSEPQPTKSTEDRSFDDFLEKDICKVCFEALADIVFVPCGHLGFCHTCTAQMKECAGQCKGQLACTLSSVWSV